MKRLVLASGNRKKVAELESLIAPFGWQVVPQTQLNVPDAIEDGLSFVENALIKARHAAKITGLPALADDSGLAVDALNGAPGIYSARFAGEPSNDANNNALLLEKMIDVPEGARSAAFHCVLALVRTWDDPVPVICHGVWQGEILQTAKGENGFGYDPLFWVPELGKASAELTPEEKNRLSHRGRAMAMLAAQWQQLGL